MTPPIVEVASSCPSPPRIGSRRASIDIADHIAVLEREGDLLAGAAASVPLHISIPTCPGWTMRDLVRHVGAIHRWATGHVADRRRERWEADLDEIVGRWPDDAELLAWFRDGHGRLVETLRSAPADLECFTFLEGPTPLATWSRRQAHETTIHRVDAEVPGDVLSAIEPAVAADGIDELVSCFITRGRGLPVSEPVSLLVDAEDTGDVWHVEFRPDSPVVTTRERRRATCAVVGPAEDLYLLLWNRRAAEPVEVSGDRGLLALWRDGIRVRWGESR